MSCRGLLDVPYSSCRGLYNRGAIGGSRRANIEGSRGAVEGSGEAVECSREAVDGSR